MPARVKARLKSKPNRRRSIIASAAMERPPKMPRQNTTTQMSIGTWRAKKPAVLQATAELSTSAMPIAVLRSAAAVDAVSVTLAIWSPNPLLPLSSPRP